MRSTSTATVRRVRAAPDRMPRKGVKCRGTEALWVSRGGRLIRRGLGIQSEQQ